MLIAEEIEDSDALGFISKVHRKQPELLVFQLSVWRSDLAETLELLERRNRSDMHRRRVRQSDRLHLVISGMVTLVGVLK